MILLIILSIIISHDGASLILSPNNGLISEVSNPVVTQKTLINIYSDKQNATVFESYPILVPPDRILQICLKDTLLLNKLHAHVSDCNNYSCMFSKVIRNESMKSVISIIRNDTLDDAASQEFKQSIQDCLVWWKLYKRFEKNVNPRRELGRCLFQTFSFKCREPVLDKIRILLLAGKE